MPAVYDLIKVPNTIAGFRITDKQQARQNLDVVAGFLALGSAMVPDSTAASAARPSATASTWSSRWTAR